MDRTYEIGSWYYLRFSDHSKDNNRGDEMELELCGKVEKITKTHLHLIYWTCNSKNGDKHIEESNHERATVALGVIVKKRKLAI